MKRPDTRDVIDEVLDGLNDLISRATHHKGEGINLLERYDYFIKNSNSGRSCTYAHKCRQLFLLSDLKEIKEHIDYIYNLLQEIK